jgi:hypothetical protein
LNPDVPTLLDQQPGIQILQALAPSKQEVNFFRRDSVFFTVRFNKFAKWKLVLKGRTSKSQKTITGSSRYLDVSNSVWYGTTDSLPVFAAGEYVDAQVILPSYPEDSTNPMLFTSLRIADNGARLLLPANAVLISDFENFPAEGAAWYHETDNGDSPLDFRIENGRAAEGQKSYKMYGKDVNRNYFVGTWHFRTPIVKPSMLSSNGKWFNLPADSNAVWFNVMVFGTGTAGTQFGVTFGEDENGDGVYDEKIEDGYAASVQVTWTGWRLVSFRYGLNAQVALPTYRPAFGINGNHKREPNHLVQIDMGSTAVPNGSTVYCNADYAVFTVGGPLVY